MEQLPEIPHVEPEVVPEMTPVASRETYAAPALPAAPAAEAAVDSAAVLSSVPEPAAEVRGPTPQTQTGISREVASDADTSNPATLEAELFATE